MNLLKEKKRKKVKGGVNSREGKDNKPPNQSQSEFSTLWPVEFLFKLFKFQMSFSS